MQQQMKSRPYPHPLADLVVCLPIEPPETLNEIGIVRPETAAERAVEGIVLRVGPGRFTENGVQIPPEVAIGDHVIFAPMAGREFTGLPGLDPGVYLILRQDEILLNNGRHAQFQESENHE